MSPPLTVILPVRNGEATIARAVRSTLSALPRDGVLLVHDDASTDGTPAILAAVTDRRLGLLTSREPRGVAGGLNRLLGEVSTPLVARMDADDITLPWRFRAQVAAVSKGVDVVWSTVIAFGDVPGRIRPGPPIPISPAAMPLHLLLSNPVAHSSMLARTDAVVSAGGYRNVKAEDYELWLRLGAAGLRCMRQAAPALLYRFHARQVTAGAGYERAAMADPGLRASYAALSRRELSREPSWFEALFGDAEPDRASAELVDFVVLMESASSRLPPAQRAFLRQKLKHLRAPTGNSASRGVCTA